ncbi:hypothetical protein [Sporosarcina sp. FSL K6-3508]|uniref:hypothetical protein n=1 Tax=Sporosarcina sp. FSL K6-3508 TaxID=2921557 RepID=UPI00315B3CB7
MSHGNGRPRSCGYAGVINVIDVVFKVEISNMHFLSKLACVGNELLCFHSLNEVALQAVGGAMRQTGDLPDWLIAGAIRQRRSEFSDVTLFLDSMPKLLSYIVIRTSFCKER